MFSHGQGKSWIDALPIAKKLDPLSVGERSLPMLGEVLDDGLQHEGSQSAVIVSIDYLILYIFLNVKVPVSSITNFEYYDEKLCTKERVPFKI